MLNVLLTQCCDIGGYSPSGQPTKKCFRIKEALPQICIQEIGQRKLITDRKMDLDKVIHKNKILKVWGYY